MITPTTLDFETYGIQSRPEYPPKPVGVSVQLPWEGKPRYLAWGHPKGNNCTEAQARRLLDAIWADKNMPVLFHNGKFDTDVGEVHMGLKPLPWQRHHDTLFLLFLTDPHAPSLSLKPASARILGLPATEQAMLKEWILANVDEARKKPSEWGAYICRAPGDMVGEYANGDVLRTLKLFKHCYRYVSKYGMHKAYDRERRLMPHLLESERMGLRVDRPRLHKDIPFYEVALAVAEQWLYKRLKREINLDSNDELVAAMLGAEVCDESLLKRTAGGKASVSKESLLGAVTDKRFLQVLGYRNRMTTCLDMFMKVWYRKSDGTGTIHPNWHQVRQGYGESGAQGARSGRIICSDPNLLNLSKEFEGRDDGYEHPSFLKELPPLPLVRAYILPDKGHVWGHRDYNQQEFRILGHYEDGSLCRGYNDNPHLDVHSFVQGEIHRIRGQLLERRPVKILNFGMVYGMGVGATAARAKMTVDQAKELKAAQKTAMPDLHLLDKSIKQRGKDGEPITTWGGRKYFVEPPRIVDDRTQTFEYKLLNYLIQGSAADVTKEAVINYHEHPDRREGRFLVTVYDEVNASMPKDKTAFKREMNALRESMESVPMDVPMLSDAKVGPSWGKLEKYEDPKGEA